VEIEPTDCNFIPRHVSSILIPGVAFRAQVPRKSWPSSSSSGIDFAVHELSEVVYGFTGDANTESLPHEVKQACCVVFNLYITSMKIAFEKYPYSISVE
jgi:hypothetical protein